MNILTFLVPDYRDASHKILYLDALGNIVLKLIWIIIPYKKSYCQQVEDKQVLNGRTEFPVPIIELVRFLDFVVHIS